jgi:hypothetical protein
VGGVGSRVSFWTWPAIAAACARGRLCAAVLVPGVQVGAGARHSWCIVARMRFQFAFGDRDAVLDAIPNRAATFMEEKTHREAAASRVRRPDGVDHWQQAHGVSTATGSQKRSNKEEAGQDTDRRKGHGAEEDQRFRSIDRIGRPRASY